MEKEKHKQQSGRHIPNIIYVIVALALLIGIILGIGMNQTPSVTQVELATDTPSPTTANSNTVDLPELQTEWAQLDITKTAVTQSNVTPTPK